MTGQDLGANTVRRSKSSEPVAVARRIGKFIGSWVAYGVYIAFGYVWAKHGIWKGCEVLGVSAVVVLALYGAFEFPWRKT